MVGNGNKYTIVRMCPPGNVYYFFSVDGIPIDDYNYDVDNTNNNNHNNHNNFDNGELLDVTRSDFE
jgi:hypothetical protein